MEILDWNQSLAIASIHEFPSRSIDFVMVFPQSGLDVDVFMELPL